MNYTNQFWQKYFRYYDVLLRVIPYQELFSSIVGKVQLKEGMKILDLGSGTGNLQLFLTDNIDVTSLDNSTEALKRLKIKFPDSAIVKHSIITRLPFDDNTFDRIVSNNVLYTLEKKQWPFIVSEIKRISKPNGIVVISNLNEDFNAIRIYIDHLRKSLKLKGIRTTLFELSKLIFPTIQMLRYNKVIKKNNDIGRYSFLRAEDQKLEFESAGLKSISPTEKVYSDQAYLDVFLNTK